MRGTGREAGFTLIELVIVLVLLAVIAAIALPRIGSGLLGSAPNLENAQDRLIGDLRNARSRAMGCGLAKRVVVEIGDDGWGIDVGEEPCRRPRENQVGSGISVAVDGDATFSFRYPTADLGDEDGDDLDEDREITLSSGATSRSVCVRAATGAIERGPC